MKRLILAAVALATVAAPMAASAQNWRRGGDRDGDGRYERYERRADRNRYDGGGYTRRERYNDNRRYARDQYRDNYRGGYNRNYGRNYYRYSAPYYGGGYNRPYYGGYAYGYGGPRRWHRGAVLPYDYRRNWYIRDYNRYGYGPPPRGYGYYRTDTGDIVVAALATGVILSLLNDNRY